MEYLSWCVSIQTCCFKCVKLLAWIHKKIKTSTKWAEIFSQVPWCTFSVDWFKFTLLIFYYFDFSEPFFKLFLFRCWTEERIQVNINRPREKLEKRKRRSEQRQFIIIIYSWWSFFLILIPSTDLWKAELTDRMTEQTQNSWKGDFPTATIASVIENRFFFFFFF